MFPSTSQSEGRILSRDKLAPPNSCDVIISLSTHLWRHHYTNFDLRFTIYGFWFSSILSTKIYFTEKHCFSFIFSYVRVGPFPSLSQNSFWFDTIPPCPKGACQILSWDVDFFPSSIYFCFKMIFFSFKFHPREPKDVA